MVKLFLITCAVLSAFARNEIGTGRSPAFDGMTFEVEFSRQSIYQGEQITAAFVITAPMPMIEVEVAKFPEFRGYWSENITLRQGPIGLTAIDATGSRNKGLIGSYLLTSMAEAPETRIEPMKLLVRIPQAYGQPAIETYLTSDVPPLTLKPLPPIPKNLQQFPFLGGVGRFLLQLETMQIPFQTKDPVSIRFSLQGEGNFPEISQIPLALPEQVEVLSRRNYTSGSGNYMAKQFETVIAVNGEEGFSSEVTGALVFNPEKARYELLPIPPISFVHIPAATPAAAPREPFQTPPSAAQWTEYHALKSMKLFYYLNALPFLFLLLQAALVQSRKFFRWWTGRPRALRKKRAEAAFAELTASNIDGFLRISAEVAYDVLQEKGPARDTRPTQSEVLRLARKRLPEKILVPAEQILQAHQQFAYSSKKQLLHPTEELAKALKSLASY